MLSAAYFRRYSQKAIVNRIDFVVTDSTLHSLEVTESVCKKFEVENILRTLCNIDPLMMLQGKIIELCREIRNSLGKSRIGECLVADVELRNQSLIMKFLKHLRNLKNRNYSAKLRNRYTHFSNFFH